MTTDRIRIHPAEPAVTAAGVNHVLLTYHYLDIGDMDGYASLTETDMVLDHPGAPPCHGRDAVLSAHTEQASPLRRHELDTVIADGETVVALGRVVHSPHDAADLDPQGAAFADVFTLSGQTLVSACRRYYYAPPPGALPSSPPPPSER